MAYNRHNSYKNKGIGFYVYTDVPGIWPLTPKIDRATWVFRKFDMRHGA